ncbi:MAG: 4Fe-4S binding protein [Bdellovibrionales bacterium]|nr:4Fe-4S binding protein [Bdellovibrionales bacterium]
MRDGSTGAVSAALRVVDRLFNRIYSSRHNPLYKSGTLALSLLLFVLVSGLYLIFFYRIAAPHESMRAIQEQVWLARWIRAAHRYASDAAAIALLVHVLRMFSQRKSWGPRFMAWLTGVLLLLLFFVSGWTGYVMVWDSFGHSLAVTGARMLDPLPFFVEPVSRSFTGAVSASPPQSFFFMNLFLHVALPLGMIVGMWVHTARLARARWFLDRSSFLLVMGAVVAASLLMPAPLGDKADFFALPTIFPADAFFAFWLPFASAAPRWALFGWVAVFGFLLIVPYLFRPARKLRPAASFSDPKLCQGCGQCVTDCPYEAVEMVPRPEGTKGSPTVALVDPSICVSCGICAGSCQSFTIGPPGRKAPEQLAALKAWIPPAPVGKVLVLLCTAQPSVSARLRVALASDPGFELRDSECAGTLHAAVFDRLSKSYAAIAMVCCPPENAIHREGIEALSERLSGERTPTLSKRRGSAPILILPTGDGEEAWALRQLVSLREGRDAVPGDQVRAPMARAAAAVVSLVLMLGIAALSGISLGKPSGDQGLLRLSWRLPGQAVQTCVKRTQEELATLPLHMRTPEACTRELLSYRLHIRLGSGATVREFEESFRPSGLRSDRPLYVERDLDLRAGDYPLSVSFTPERADAPKATRLTFEGLAKIRPGRIELLTLKGPDTLSWANSK